MNKRKTIEIFKQEVFDIVQNEYKVLSDNYINNKTKIKFIHTKCNNVFETAPNDFLSHHHRCPYCNGGSSINKEDKFISKIKNFGNFVLKSKYIDCKTKVKIKHLDCNNIFEVVPNDFLRKKHKCPYCNKLGYTHEQFIEKINKFPDIDLYKPLSIYKGNREDFTFLHLSCNNTFTVKPYRFIQGDRCPYCNTSKGEDFIIHYLDNRNIEYSRKFVFEDLYYKSKSQPLNFDFKLNLSDEKIILLEYDGEQHFRPFGKSEENLKKFKDQVKRDKMKDDYCKSHENIDFYRISYKDFNNINTILNKIINNYK